MDKEPYRHKWISKYAPRYTFLNDIWTRESDYKKFRCSLARKGWIAEDGEFVKWPNKAMVMENGRENYTEPPYCTPSDIHQNLEADTSREKSPQDHQRPDGQA